MVYYEANANLLSAHSSIELISKIDFDGNNIQFQILLGKRLQPLHLIVERVVFWVKESYTLFSRAVMFRYVEESMVVLKELHKFIKEFDLESTLVGTLFYKT